jgi:hypothetical protein
METNFSIQLVEQVASNNYDANIICTKTYNHWILVKIHTFNSKMYYTIFDSNTPIRKNDQMTPYNSYLT